MKKIVYFLAGAAFLNAKLLSLDISIMQLSIYRLSLLIIGSYMILNNLFIDKKINIKCKGRQSLIVRFYLFWTLYSVYSLAWVMDVRAGIRVLFFIASGFLCIWVVTSFIKNEKDFRIIFNILLVMIIIHNIIGWFELNTGIYKFSDVSRIDRYNQFSYNREVRLPLSWLSNPNDFATLMTLGVFISLIVFLNSRKIWMKILSMGTLISSVLLVIETTSRGNLVGLALGMGAVILAILLKRVNKNVIFFIIFIGILGLAIYPPINRKVIELVSTKILSTFGTKSLSVRSDVIRFNLIRNGLIFLANTIGFGTGVGNIEYWMSTKQVYEVGSVLNMHNWWAEILVGYGILIFVGYVFIYFIEIKTLFTSIYKGSSRFIKNTSLGLFGFMMAYIISSVSSSSNIDAEWLWLFWAVLIAFIGFVERTFKENKQSKTHEDLMEI